MILLEENRDAVAQYGRDELRRMHYQMVLIRHFEERVGESYLRAKIGGYCHLNLGEEAVVAGSIAAVAEGDYILTTYREHGHTIARGVDPGAVMAELYGKSTGTSKGRGGSMHLYDAEKHFFGGYGIVGAHMPLATGIALAINMRRQNDAVICYIGDGATNIGSFHESMNVAQLWHLPVVFVIVNNQYGMGTRVAQASSVPELWRKAQGYDMISERVDGTDILAVRRSTEQAMQRARELKQPTLMELVCYRYRGHSMADPARYRSKEEVDEWMQRDPIERYRLWLKSHGLITDEEIQADDEQALQTVEEAVQFADASPDPGADELFDYLYADTSWEEGK